MKKQGPQRTDEATERLVERLTAMKTPPMPTAMEQRLRARLRTEVVSARPRPRALSPAQQWALVAALMAFVAYLLSRQMIPILFSMGQARCVPQSPDGIANAATPLPTGPSVAALQRIQSLKRKKGAKVCCKNPH